MTEFNFEFDSTIDFPEQISEAANGDIIVAGFSDPSGIYRYNSAGVEIDFIDVGPFIRGVYELANGNFLFTNFSGVFFVNPNTLFVTTIVEDGNNRFIELADLPAKSRLTNLGPHSSLFLSRFHYLYGCSILFWRLGTVIVAWLSSCWPTFNH